MAAESARRLLALLSRPLALWVALGAVWGLAFPDTASAGKPWIPWLLAAVMLAMGLGIEERQWRGLKDAGRPVVVGFCLQFLVMPLAAWLLTLALDLPPEIALGVILVGACPGGTASNVVTWLARGDVALSVAMTTASTLAAPIMTPLWVWLLAGSRLPVDAGALMLSVAKIVLLPVLAGALIRRMVRIPSWLSDHLLPLVAVLVIAWIVGVIAGLNHGQLLALAPWTAAAVVMLNLAGLGAGYFGARRAGLDVTRSRTVAIEVGMQNSGLAVALAVAHFSPEAALAGALFSLWHNLSGPMLAAFWRRRPS